MKVHYSELAQQIVIRRAVVNEYLTSNKPSWAYHGLVRIADVSNITIKTVTLFAAAPDQARCELFKGKPESEERRQPRSNHLSS